MGKHVFDLGWLYILWENDKINIAGNNATDILASYCDFKTENICMGLRP